MSLDVTLRSTALVKRRGTGVYVRDDGRQRELTLAEVRERWPDFIEVKEIEYETDVLFEGNITHNLNKMAEAADLYNALWRPDIGGMVQAKQLIDPLREGLHRLKLTPDHFKKFNPENGWGTYEQLVGFVEEYLNACYAYPEAIVEVSR